MADITIEEGDTLEVDYSLENTGDGSGTFDPRLLVQGVQEDQDTGITLDPAQTATGTLQWPTESGDAVTDALAEAVTDDTSDSITVTVESAIPDSGIYWVEALSNSEPELVELSTPYDMTTEVSSTPFPFAPSRTNVTFRPDGLRCYALRGSDDNLVRQYDFPEPFDVNNASISGSSSIATNNRFEQAIFSSDGTKMFTNQGDAGGTDDDNITRYSVSDPWDISNISEDFTTSMPPNLGAGIGPITFNTDGSRVYYGGRNHGQTVFQSDLSTPFDPRSVTSTDSFDTNDDDPLAIQLSVDGTKMYTAHHSPDFVYQWDLNTPFDITTATNKIEIRPDVLNNSGLYFHIQPHYKNASNL